MKLIRVFPETPNPDAEFWINPKKISSVLIQHIKDTDKYQLWVNVGGESYHVDTFSTHSAAIDYLTDIIKE